MKKQKTQIKKQQIKDFKMLIKNLPEIASYITLSKDFFKNLNDILSDLNLSNDDKLIMINNLFKEFESSVLR